MTSTRSSPSGPHVLMNADAVGGVFSYALTLARALREGGADVTLVLQGPSPRDHQRAALQSVSGLRVIETDLALEWRDVGGRDAARARAALERIARDVRPDIVHLNSYREAQADFGAPVLVMAHSCVGSWWRACRGGAPDREWDRYRADVKAGLDAADAWAAPSRAFHDDIEALYAPRTSGHVLHNGIEPVAASTRKTPVVLAAGRMWDEAKDVRTIVAAASQTAWPVLVAGATRDEHGNEVEGGAARLLGEVPRETMLARMGEAAIFASASVYEPFGLAVCEAAASACALILTDIPTARELWDGAALFFAPRDAAALAAGINRLAEDATLRDALGRRARERAARYTARRMAEETIALHHSLLDAPAAIRSAPPAELRA